jgi:hypothetical protein
VRRVRAASIFLGNFYSLINGQTFIYIPDCWSHFNDFFSFVSATKPTGTGHKTGFQLNFQKLRTNVSRGLL